ncbi:MAG: EAL domain-containing protein [Pseudomonadota bacterium]
MRPNFKMPTGLLALLCTLLFAVSGLNVAATAYAAEAIDISREDTALDLTQAADIFRDRGETFQVSTAPDAEGIIREIEVEALKSDTAGNWAVLILTNTTSDQIDRFIVSPHYRLVGSGIIWPDLGSERIVNITPSEGFSLDRIPDSQNDVFAITLNPGAIITLVAELGSADVPQIYLWDEEEYKEVVNSYTLYQGIVLGIAGLLALFLTVIFVVRGTATFPVTAFLAWVALGYVCVDFGFVNQFFEMTPEQTQVWRAISESALAGALALFLFAYLSLNRWSVKIRAVAASWVVLTVAISVLMFYEPSVAAGVARLSLAATAIIGFGFIAYTAYRGYDRGVMLFPSWLLFIAFVYASFLAVTGRVDNDIIQPALAGGLVMIILLIGFTVMQNAFAGGAIQQNLFSNTELQSLAMKGSDNTVWSWNVNRDRITTLPDLSFPLGIEPGSLQSVTPKQWLKHLHGEDKDRLEATLDSVLEQRRGRMAVEFRIRSATNHYHWYRLAARPIVGPEGRVIRCVGTITNIDNHKRAEERLMQDSVHDNLTGLPNRELFLDRVRSITSLASISQSTAPTIIVLDLDRFREINETAGISAGDTMLIAVARRLSKILSPQDTLARIGGDQFGVIIVSETDATRIAELAERLKQAIRTPIEYSGKEIVLTASAGLATWAPAHGSAVDLFSDAELALFHAKRFGGDRSEPFRPAFRAADTNKPQMEADLRRAIEREEISLVYQPITEIESGEIIGFEALMRWNHPRRGEVPPVEFIALAERSDLIVELGTYAAEQAMKQLMEWDSTITDRSIFVSVNVSAPQLIRDDFANVIGKLQARYAQRKHTLKLEITETCIMANPEFSVHVLEKIQKLGIGLALDDFGTGYSSLSYLARFPFDTLKIDQSFLGMDDETRPVLLRSMVEMAHALGLKVVAEGAEDLLAVRELREVGCDLIQGYAAGLPMTADAAADLLRSGGPLMAMEDAAE